MNFELSKNNHFRYGFNGEAFNFRTQPTDQWWVSYGPCQREPLSFREECLLAAKDIEKAARGQPIWVLFSGGVDSEVALQSFYHAGVPVKAAILRFEDDLNEHDIRYAFSACQKLQIPYQVFDLRVRDFWKGIGFDYARRTQCTTPQLITTMYLVDQLEGFVVLGSGECYLTKIVPEDYQPGISPYEPSSWQMWEREKIASWYRHFQVRGRAGAPGFFQYTPELILSYLKDPFVADLANNRRIGKLSTKTSKLAIYQQHFELEDRPKFTGFEKLQEEDHFYRSQLEAMFPHSQQIVKTNYEDLLKMLEPRTERV